MSETISSLSREEIMVPVSAKENGAVVDPSADTVQMAFTLNADPVSGDWKSAAWDTDNGTYKARCLVGPGGTVVLTPGLYQVWVKVTDSPEVPVKRAGNLRVI